MTLWPNFNNLFVLPKPKILWSDILRFVCPRNEHHDWLELFAVMALGVSPLGLAVLHRPDGGSGKSQRTNAGERGPKLRPRWKYRIDEMVNK